MNAVLERSATTPYSAKNMSKPINFYYARPDARSVSLIGDFNGWNPNSLPMQRRGGGLCSFHIALTAGPHQNLFLGACTPTPHPRAPGPVHPRSLSKSSFISESSER